MEVSYITWLGLLLLSSVLTGVSSSRFYLTLDEVGTSTTSASIGSGSLTDQNNSTCAPNSREVSCSCGEDLWTSIQLSNQALNATCERFSIVENSSSPFSFCEDTLLNLGPGYVIRMENASEVPETEEVESFDSSSLEQLVGDIEQNLRGYKKVLDRTVVHVLILTRESKCFCFVSE